MVPHVIHGMRYAESISSRAPRMDDIALWTGKEFVVYYSKMTNIIRYDPVTSKTSYTTIDWQPLSAANKLEWQANLGIADYAGVEGAYAAGHLLTAHDNFELNRFSQVTPHFAVQDIDLEKHLLRPLLPGGRNHAELMYALKTPNVLSAGDRILLWGYANAETGHELRGAFFDPKQDTWQVLPSLPTAEGRWYGVVEWIKDRLVVWDYLPDGKGFIYVPAPPRWEAMDLQNAPPPRERLVAHSASNRELLVYGGYDDKVGFVKSGGRFDPETNQWFPMSTTDAPVPAREFLGQIEDDFIGMGNQLQAVWAENFWIVNGSDLRFYSPDEDRWSLCDRLIDPLPIHPSYTFWTGVE